MAAMTGGEHPTARDGADERGGWRMVESHEQLTALVGEPIPRVRDKVRSELAELDRAWLAASPFCMIATAAADGSCDVSPKGDPAGELALVLDSQTIAIAERPGNRRVDGYRNIVQNPRVGLNFLIPGRGDTLRINGRALLVAEAPFLDRMVVRGHRPTLALVVEIEEVFHHCAKAFLRSGLWDPESWDPENVVPRRAVVARELDVPGASLGELDAYYGAQYAEGLYG